MEFFNLNENSILVSWKDELNSSLTSLISSYKTEILSLCKDDIKEFHYFLFLKALLISLRISIELSVSE